MLTSRHTRGPAAAITRSAYHPIATVSSPRRSLWWTTGVPIGRVAGIPIFVAPSWFLSVAAIALISGPVVNNIVPNLSAAAGYGVAVLLGVLLGASVLAHELGHCVAARHFGVGVVQVRLFILGGVSEIARVPTSARESAGVASAGPIVSALITAVFSGLALIPEPRTVSWLLALQMAIANGIITAFNLLPALPLDGGRVLRAAIWQRTGSRRKGTVAAVVGGYLVGSALIVWSVLRLISGDQGSVVQGLVGVAMAYYIAVGARAEQTEPEPKPWPAGTTVGSFARRTIQLPAETPVGSALTSAAGQEVILLGADGSAVGILDTRTALSLAAYSPGAPATRAAQPVLPGSIVLFSDGSAEVDEQLRSEAATHFLLIGKDGLPQGVICREDFPQGKDRQPSRPDQEDS